MQNLVEEIYSAIEERGVIVTLGKVFGVGASVELPVAESICQESVERLALSVRSQNCLMRAGIDTIERLMDAIMENRLAGVRSLGKKSLAEIRAKLCEFAYESTAPGVSCRTPYNVSGLTGLGTSRSLVI